MRYRIAAVLIALVLLAPMVQAREGHGELVATDVGEIHGAANVSGTNLSIVHYADDRGTLTLDGAFTVIHESTTYYQNGSTDEETVRDAYDDATLDTLPEAVVAVRLTGSAELGARPPDEYGRTDDPELLVTAGSPPQPTVEEATVSKRTRPDDSESPQTVTSERPGQPSQQQTSGQQVAAHPGLGVWRNLSLASMTPLTSDAGETLYLVDGTVRVVGSDGTTTYDTGVERRDRTVCDQSVGGQCVQSHEEEVVTVNRTKVTIDSADLAVDASQPQVQPSASRDDGSTTKEVAAAGTFLTGDVVDLDANATLHLREATGEIVVGDESWEVDDEPVTVGGEITIRFSTAAGTGVYGAAFDGDVRYVKAPVERTFSPEAVAGAAGGLALLGLLVYLWPALKFAATKLAVVPFFTQVEGEDVLDNETRNRIFEAIQSDPGLSASDLADEADCGWGTVVYHLAVLEQNALVVSTRDGRHRRFFPYKGMDFRHKDVFSAIRNETTAAILNAVRDAPGIHQKALRKEMDLAASTVNWHISKLEDAGLVEKERDGRKVRYVPGPNIDVLGEDQLESAAG